MVLIGSLGMFIYGMKIMSEGIQKAAGRTLRNILGSLTSNTFKGALTGFGVTALIQSSSVTTVMTVSFVNAGVLTLLQATGIIMGANIGTTLTGWIINIFGFEVDLSAYILVLLAIGVPLMFVNKSKLKGIANAIIGFCLFFIGLEFLKGAVPTLGPDSALIHFFIDFKDIPFISTLLFVLLGTLLTVIIQASSAALALTMTLVAGGIMPFEVAAAICLGENVGTTITAQLAATVANVHAKRAAWIHTLFNLIGVIWVILLFPYFLEGIKLLMIYFGQGDPFENPKEYANTGIAIFHTAFNICNVLLLIWFAPQLVKLSEFIVKSKGGADEEFHLDYIGTGYMSSPDLSLLEAKKEIAKFGELTSRMSLFARSMLLEKVKKKQRKIAERISKYEDITDRVEVEIANYLNKLTESGLSNETASRIRGMNSIANNLERIGDIFYQISKAIERKEEEKIEFTKKQRHNLIEMFDLVDEAFRIMCENLNKHSADVHIEEAMLAERNINHKRDQLRREYLRTVSEDKDAHLQGGIIYNSIFSSLERVGDHIINVSEGIVGKV
ncbi:MAG: Na/Pi cotransporter family protein [Brumimicrobium sp.]|nr:Na/Pi cotransporter family protein [Brumimicrobium sp.]